MNKEPPLDEPKSKSQIKREALALQKLGESLVELNANELEKMPLDDTLRDAIKTAQRITSHGGLRRQFQYIGKLMRECDPVPIETALAIIKNQDHQATARFHRMEQWRDRLLNEGDTALTEFIKNTPEADAQKIRQWIRLAKQELEKNKPPKSSRALFRYIRELSTPTR